MIEQLFKVTVSAPEHVVLDYFTDDYAKWLYSAKVKAFKTDSTFGNIIQETAYFTRLKDAQEFEQAWNDRYKY